MKMEVLETVTMKIPIVWYLSPYGLADSYQCW
jgi:hypothetical protein